MTSEISPAWMRARIDESNKGASQNRNLYPIQEQATLMEIWEQADCPCGAACRCRSAGCGKHWKLKRGVTAEEFRFAFLRTFVDRCEHLNLLKALERDMEEYPIDRYREAYRVLQCIGNDWGHLSGMAAAYPRTLFCDGWDEVPFREEWKTIKVKEGIYRAKMFCLLLPDTCVPFDSRSLVKMQKFLGLTTSSSYYALLSALRERFLPLLANGGDAIGELRRLDAPDKEPMWGLAFDSRFISFPRPGFSYGVGYMPKERAVGFVLDKCFYNPSGGE